MIHKACAVALHPDGAPLRVIAFDHPTAGTQLVKGTVNPGEAPLKAAARELWEETGLTVRAGLLLGQSTEIAPGEYWHFALLRPAPPVPDRWSHQTRDDHGHVFGCFWQEIDAPHQLRRPLPPRLAGHSATGSRESGPGHGSQTGGAGGRRPSLTRARLTSHLTMRLQGRPVPEALLRKIQNKNAAQPLRRISAAGYAAAAPIPSGSGSAPPPRR